MKEYNSKVFRVIKKCWREISLKDKGLILIMILLLLQCIHNLYNVDSTISEYIAINVVIRSSVAGIFGYFLSSNFLIKDKGKTQQEIDEYKIEVLNKLLKNEDIREKVEDEYKEIINIEQEEKEKYFCNKGLQNGIAVGLCIIITLCLIVGVNFNLIAKGSIATISQFRDIISGCIGFLLGNNNR